VNRIAPRKRTMGPKWGLHGTTVDRTVAASRAVVGSRRNGRPPTGRRHHRIGLRATVVALSLVVGVSPTNAGAGSSQRSRLLNLSALSALSPAWNGPFDLGTTLFLERSPKLLSECEAGAPKLSTLDPSRTISEKFVSKSGKTVLTDEVLPFPTTKIAKEELALYGNATAVKCLKIEAYQLVASKSGGHAVDLVQVKREPSSHVLTGAVAMRIFNSLSSGSKKVDFTLIAVRDKRSMEYLIDYIGTGKGLAATVLQKAVATRMR
jgi:hypothetical protein